MIVRRLCTAVLMTLICLGVSCSSDEPTAVTRFCSDVTIECDDTVFNGKLECDPSSQTTLLLTSPAEISGVTFCWDGESLRTEWNGETCKLGTVSESALVVLIHAAFSDIAQRGVAQGVVNGRQYRCAFDEQNGNPVTLTLQEMPLTVRFENVSVSSKDTTNKMT